MMQGENAPRQVDPALHLHALDIPGAWLVEPVMHIDDRGAFSRTFDAAAFAAHGLETAFVEWSISSNRKQRTLRGLHFQQAPHTETKLVRCSRGAIFDVLVDLRAQSPAFGRWTGLVLDSDTPRSLYIPPGCAHGFLTLVDETDVQYAISPAYHPAATAGLRWDDPTLAIAWPALPLQLSARDQVLPSFEEWRGRRTLAPDLPGGQLPLERLEKPA